MMLAWASALVFAVTGGSEPAGTGGWRSPAARCEAMAGSLRVPPALHGIVTDLCRRSPTFRRQVARLADAGGVTGTGRLLRAPAPAPGPGRTGVAPRGGPGGRPPRAG